MATRACGVWLCCVGRADEGERRPDVTTGRVGGTVRTVAELACLSTALNVYMYPANKLYM